MKRFCVFCKRRSAGEFVRRRCPGCYKHLLSWERLKRTEANFKTKWKVNRLLFERYLCHLKSKSYLRSQDSFVAVRFSAALRSHPVRPIRSWLDVYELRDKMQLGHSPHSNRRGCPITMLGCLLEKDGKLPSKGLSNVIYSVLQWFPQSERAAVKAYSERYQKRTSQQQVVNRLKHVLVFYLWFTGDIFEVPEDLAKNYLRKMSLEKNAIVFRQNVNELRAFYQWLVVNGFAKTNPFLLSLDEFNKVCPHCKKVKLVTGGEIYCSLCLWERRLLPMIEKLGQKVIDAPVYNQYLFQLHLDYIKRYRITNSSHTDVGHLVRFLNTGPVDPILLWKDVKALSVKFKTFVGQKKINRGCPFNKIGHMLEELGVIPFLAQDEVTALERNLLKLPVELQSILRRHAAALLKRRRRHSTAMCSVFAILYLKNWLDGNYPDTELLRVSEKVLTEYLTTIPVGTREHYRGALNVFFKWCKSENIVESNPLAKIAPSDPPPELAVCSRKEFEGLLRFIKDPSQSPQAAMMLTLILFWGFSKKELTYSTFDIKDDLILIQVFQQPISYAHPSPTRKSALSLPKNPKWFESLQRRFIQDWRAKYAKLKSPSPRKPLFILPSNIHNRPAPNGLVLFIGEATRMAAGKSIPIRILRTTCGHIHTYRSDASMLAELGWTRDYAFTYTWMPRKYHF